MKKGIAASLGLVFTAALLAAGCGQSTGGNANMNHDAMNHQGMNHNAMNMNAMNHNSANMNAMNHDSLNMNAMSGMKSDPNAASAPYDLQFIDTMTHHHEGALAMARMALEKSSNAELKTFAQKIIDDQKREIAEMKTLRDKWYAGAPPAKNMEMPGMQESMKMMQSGEMEKMMRAAGRDFDLVFLDMMIPHHRDAVAMSQDARKKAEHAEIKTLADRIIEAQNAEIKQMTDWRAAWEKK